MVVPLVILAMAAPLQDREPVDSAKALRLADEAVKRLYVWNDANLVYRKGTCLGESLRDCYGGDWSCDPGWNCLQEDWAHLRKSLLRELDGLAPHAGGSAWLFRQRVSLALKIGEPERALGIAESCYGTEWWCKALRGLARHELSPGSEAALAAFDSAVALAQVFPCSSDTPALERFWWLADPLWSRPGTSDARTTSRDMRYCRSRRISGPSGSCGVTRPSIWRTAQRTPTAWFMWRIPEVGKNAFGSWQVGARIPLR